MRQIDLEKIEQWSTGYGLSKDKCAETLTLCESLTSTWFTNHAPIEKESFEMVLIDDDGAEAETLHGINESNAALTMADILLTKSKAYSSISLRSFSFENGRKVVNSIIGELDIDKKC